MRGDVGGGEYGVGSGRIYAECGRKLEISQKVK